MVETLARLFRAKGYGNGIPIGRTYLSYAHRNSLPCSHRQKIEDESIEQKFVSEVQVYLICYLHDSFFFLHR